MGKALVALSFVTLGAVGIFAFSPFIVAGFLLLSAVLPESEGKIFDINIENPPINISLQVRHNCLNVRKEYRCMKFRTSDSDITIVEMFPDWGTGLPIGVFAHDGNIRVIDCISLFDFNLLSKNFQNFRLSDISGREKHLVTFLPGFPDDKVISETEWKSARALATERDCGSGRE